MEKIISAVWKLCRTSFQWLVFDLFHLKISEEHWKSILQFVKFGMVGLSNSVLYYILYVITLLVMQKMNFLVQIDYLLAQFVGFAISVLWSFYWNRKYVFQAQPEQISWPKALLKSYISYGFTGIILNSILAVLWVQVFGIPKLIAPVFNLLVSVPLNYILNKFWAFRKK